MAGQTGAVLRTYHRVKEGGAYRKQAVAAGQGGIHPLVVGNWKMNPASYRAAEQLLREVHNGIGDMGGVEVGVAPPVVFLHSLQQKLATNGDGILTLGVQNIHSEPSGAHTGEISAEQAKDAGASFAIIGHSEWRDAHLRYALGTYFDQPLAPTILEDVERGDLATTLFLIFDMAGGSPDSSRKSAGSLPLDRTRLLKGLVAIFSQANNREVNRRVHAALRAGLAPIVCVGETLEQKNEGQAENIVKDQMRKGLEGLSGAQMGNVVIAYEPVWAIGTGQTATPQQADKMHGFIRNLIHEQHGEEIALALRILYGGSVKPDNINELMAMPNVDGALVGGASLDPGSFTQICRLGPA